MATFQKLKDDVLSFATVSSALLIAATSVANASEDVLGTYSNLQTAVRAELQGIAGTGLQGIAGTGLQGIAGTGLQGGRLPVVAYGPVEEILEDGYVVLGQFVALVNETPPTPLAVGDVVVVFGLVSENGLVSDQIVRLDEVSIDGSSPVFVAGLVGDTNPQHGEITIGNLTVQIGAAGVNPEAFQVQPGQYVEVFGLRFGGLVVAESVALGVAVDE